MVKTVMKKKVLLIALLSAVLFLPSCFSLKNSGSGSDDFSVEDDIIDEVEWCEIIFDSAGGTAVAAQMVRYLRGDKYSNRIKGSYLLGYSV